jgi:hypothetical protein
MIRFSFALALAFCLGGCEYFFSDVATRIRYALLDESARLQSSTSPTASFSLRPDHWPDACPAGQGYRVVFSPYKGNKQVAVGDIFISCKGGGVYYTGLGAESIYVSRELTAEKRTEDELRITLRRTAAGTEIVALE